MTVLAIDPGSEKSAWVLWDGQRVIIHGICENDGMVGNLQSPSGWIADATLVVEKIESYGMAVGREVFDTVWWAGRFHEAWASAGKPAFRMPRRDVKLHMCGQPRAKDANIRQALLNRFGGRQKAVGTKNAPGPLFGIKADEWQALALAVTWMETV